MVCSNYDLVPYRSGMIQATYLTLLAMLVSRILVFDIPWSVQAPVLYFDLYCVHWCWQCRVCQSQLSNRRQHNVMPCVTEKTLYFPITNYHS